MYSSLTISSILSVFALHCVSTASAVGIGAGYRGFYACSDINFAGLCHWHEIDPDLQDGRNCIALNNTEGFRSLGPDPGLWVDVYDKPNCDNIENKGPQIKKLSCPGSKNMQEQKVLLGAQMLWIKVGTHERKDLPKKLPAECEFDSSNEASDLGSWEDSETGK